MDKVELRIFIIGLNYQRRILSEKSIKKNRLVRWKYLLIPVFLVIFLCFQTIVSATDSPQLVVRQFYQWYVQNQNQAPGQAQRRIAEQETAFTSVLYQQLVQGFQKRPGSPRGFLNFDVFCDCQANTFGATVRSVRQVASGMAEVNIDVSIGMRRPAGVVPMQVIVVREGDRWQIQNIFYTRDQDYRNLLSTLRAIN